MNSYRIVFDIMTNRFHIEQCQQDGDWLPLEYLSRRDSEQAQRELYELLRGALKGDVSL